MKSKRVDKVDFYHMIKTVRNISLFLLLSWSNDILAQTDATLLVTPNVNAKILVDGVEQGQTKASVALKITSTGGEHYVEIQTIDGLTIGQIVQFNAGKEETLKINIGNAETVLPESVPVTELNFELPDTATVASWQLRNQGAQFPYPEYYYAFEKGDEIILNLATLNKSETNKIVVSTYPDGTERFSNQSFNELSDVHIKVPERSIYRFAFESASASPHQAFLKISRKPAKAETVKFNPKVTFKKAVVPVSIGGRQDFFISGAFSTAEGGKSRIIVPVALPPNTVEWFYRFSAARDTTVIEKVKKNFSLLDEVSKQLQSLAHADTIVNTLAIEKLSQPPGANFCDIYFLGQPYVQAFETKADKQWRYLPDGSKENAMAGNVKITCCNSGQYFLGIRNPDATNGVHVSVEVVAITVSDGYVMENE